VILLKLAKVAMQLLREKMTMQSWY